MKTIFTRLLCLTLLPFFASAQTPFKESKVAKSNNGLEENPTINWDAFQNTSIDESYDYQTLNFQTLQIPTLRTRQYDIKLHNGKIAGFIEGKLAPEKRVADLHKQAELYIQDVHKIMGTTGSKDEFVLLAEWEDDLQFDHLKYNQQYEGVPIFGAEIILHAKDKVFIKMNGQYVKTNVLQTANESNPTIDKTSVEFLLKPKLKGYVEIPEEHKWLLKNHKQWETNLVYLEIDNQLRLSYHISVYHNIVEWFTYFVDAHTGEIIREYSNICKFNHAHDETCSHHESLPPDGPRTAVAENLFGQNVSINTYEVGNGFYMIDGSRDMFNGGSSNLPTDPVGAIWTLDAMNTSPQSGGFNYNHVFSSNNNWNQEEAVSAHSNAGQAYEYFKNTHNRESINGSGGNVLSFVNIADEDGSSIGNAFWAGQSIFYGNGDSRFLPLGRGLDVAGHEMSHGVIQNTANLEYFRESGAINESYADCFGAMIDRDDWTIGEDVIRLSAFPSGAMRDLEDPANGAAPGDFNGGWQPTVYSDRFTGSEDNGGVHLNSGIPNHAFYRFAIQVGKTKAEKVYYRALTNYLTRSSQFVDLRAAIVSSTEDLYSASDVSAAEAAFDAVGIGQGQPGNYQQDVDENPGQDLVIFTDPDRSNLFLSDGEGNLLTSDNSPISNTNIISKPSVTDDGSTIVFTGADERLYVINIDWSNGTFSEEVFQDNPSWRNVIISKNGRRIAALPNTLNRQVITFDLDQQSQTEFTLYNPTYSDGVNTGDVLYADVLEFDLSSNYIMYDAENEIPGIDGSINYWDIGLINVWDPSRNIWAEGEVQKLIAGLAEGVSIGNPTFSKNSPFIIAFDFIEADERAVIGMNIETQTFGTIFENNILGYPNFSNDDSKVIFDFNSSNYGEELAVVDLANDKINAQGDASFFFTQEAQPSQWGVWFSNGDRNLNTSIENDLEENIEIKVYPNPATDILSLELGSVEQKIQSIEIINNAGQIVKLVQSPSNGLNTISVQDFIPGMYFLNFNFESETHQRAVMIK